MATFSQGFLSSLGRPQMAEGLFSLGAAIGGVPGQIRERKRREEELKRFDQLTQASQQGVTAAQEGNITDLDAQLQNLREQMAAAETIEEKRAISQLMGNLQRLRPEAKQTATSNNAKKMIEIEDQLQTLAAGDPQRVVLQAEFDKLRTNPETARQYQQRKMGIWNFQKAQEDRKAEQWLNDNMSSIDSAIAEGDMDSLDSIIQNAGSFSDEAQEYAAVALRNQEARVTYEEKNIDRTVEPNVDFYKKEVEALPEELRKPLEPILAQYTKFSEGYDGKQWTTTASRVRASRAETQLRQALERAQSAEAAAAFNDRRQLTKTLETALRTATLELEQADVLTIEEERTAVLNAKATTPNRKGIPSKEEVEKQRKLLLDAKRKTAVQKVTYYQGLLAGDRDVQEPVPEEVDDSPFRIINGQRLSIRDIQGDVAEFGKEEVIRLLKEEGATQDDIDFYFPPKLSEREKRMQALGTRKERMDTLGRGFVARMKPLGSREQRMQKLGTREERMQALKSGAGTNVDSMFSSILAR